MRGVGRVLDEEVERLAGPRHARKGEGEVIFRHGSNPGSVRLGGQRHPVRVPRVRGLEGEARLESYERLHWAAGEVEVGCSARSCLGSRVVTTRPRTASLRSRNRSSKMSRGRASSARANRWEESLDRHFQLQDIMDGLKVLAKNHPPARRVVMRIPRG